MRVISLAVAATLMLSPGVALAQSAPTPGQPEVLPAPRGHAQPRRETPPTIGMQKGAQLESRDSPEAVERRLERSNNAAISSICADCLKPWPKDQP